MAVVAMAPMWMTGTGNPPVAVGRHTGPLTPTAVLGQDVAPLTYLKFKLGGYGGASPAPVSYTLPRCSTRAPEGLSLEKVSSYLSRHGRKFQQQLTTRPAQPQGAWSPVPAIARPLTGTNRASLRPATTATPGTVAPPATPQESSTDAPEPSSLARRQRVHQDDETPLPMWIPATGNGRSVSP